MRRVPLLTSTNHVAGTSARIAAYPIVAELCRAYAVALVEPMVGCPWAGEPCVDWPASGSGLPAPPTRFDREMGRYAAALLRKREPAFATGDLSHLRTRFAPPATVLFVSDVRCRRSQRHPDGLKTLVIAEVELPSPALGFGSTRLPAPAGASPRPLPREVPRLAAPSRPRQESPPMSAADHRPPQEGSSAARAFGGRS